MKKPKLSQILELIVQHNITYESTPEDCGSIEYHTMKINIDPDQTIREKVDTLVHECCHAWYHEREIKHRGQLDNEKQVRLDTKRLMGEIYS